jgi:hypothetical protein
LAGIGTQMNHQWAFLSAVLVMSIVVAGGISYFVFLDEGLTAIFFGLPPTIAIGGSLWLTRNFFQEEPR